MSDHIRIVEYYYVLVPDKPGEGARMLGALRDAGINLLGFSGFPEGRRAQLDFIPADPAAFRQVARRSGWKVVGPKRGFLAQGTDRPGAIADLLDRLAEKKIGVTALDAVCADGRYGALFWVSPRDVKRVAALLGAV